MLIMLTSHSGCVFLYIVKMLLRFSFSMKTASFQDHHGSWFKTEFSLSGILYSTFSVSFTNIELNLPKEKSVNACIQYISLILR